MHQDRLFIVKSLQELSTGHWLSSLPSLWHPGHLVSVHHPLVVDYGAWFAFFQPLLRLIFVSGVCLGIAGSFIVIIVPVIILMKDAGIFPLFSPAASVTKLGYPSVTLLWGLKNPQEE